MIRTLLGSILIGQQARRQQHGRGPVVTEEKGEHQIKWLFEIRLGPAVRIRRAAPNSEIAQTPTHRVVCTRPGQLTLDRPAACGRRLWFTCKYRVESQQQCRSRPRVVRPVQFDAQQSRKRLTNSISLSARIHLSRTL